MAVARRSAVAALVLAAGAALGLPAGAGPTAVAPARAACILSVTYLGAPYLDAGSAAPGDVVARAGTAAIPPCDDTPGLGPVERATPVAVGRLRGIAPRFAVTILDRRPRPRVLVAAGHPCGPPSAGPALACLRMRTRALREGPALVAPPSAASGSAIRLTVHARDAGLRRRILQGLDSTLQRREGGRWRSLAHLTHPLPDDGALPPPVPFGSPGHAVPLIGLPAGVPRPVRLPAAEAGPYRIVTRVQVGGRGRWLAAGIHIR